MIEKCSESAGLTRAFPSELSGLYIKEELDKEEVVDAVPVEPTPLTEAPKATAIPEVNHTPVQPTNEPRPGEKKAEKPDVAAEPKPKKLAKDTTITEVVTQQVEPVPATEPVQKMDVNDRLRALIAKGAPKDQLKDYLLRGSGATNTKSIPSEWIEPVLKKLEGMNKEELVAEMTAKPEPKEEF